MAIPNVNVDVPSANQATDAEVPGEPGRDRSDGGIWSRVTGKERESQLTTYQNIQDITDYYNKSVDFISKELMADAGFKGQSDVSSSTGLGNEDPKYAEYVSSIVQRYRTPWVISCRRWMSQGMYIVFRANPTNISWRITLRGNEQLVRAGRVQHLWRHKLRNTYFNEPEVDIQFQSGNIMPVRIYPPLERGSSQASDFPFGTANVDFQVPGMESFSTNNYSSSKIPKMIKDTSEKVRVPQGLWNFYQFLALMDEQRILDDGTTNLVYIFYHSNVFPSLVLSGLFSPQNGVSFTEDAENPFEIKWSATFTVYSSTPSLGVSGLMALKQRYIGQGFRDIS